MPTRFVIVLIAFGILLQGCTLQKRSLMPGWHVERIAKESITPDESPVEGANHTAASESLGMHAESTTLHQDVLIPMKALMAYSPSVDGVPELNTLHISQPADAFETLPLASHEIDSQQAKRDTKAPGGLIAALLYLLSAVTGVGGFLFILIGLAYGDSAVILVSALAIVASAFLFFAAGNPNSEWRRRAVERYRDRLLDRVERSEERAEKEDELEANRLARQEELQLKEEQRRKKQEAEKQARKAKRQAFLQDPFVKIALGFGAIIGLYLLLF